MTINVKPFVIGGLAAGAATSLGLRLATDNAIDADRRKVQSAASAAQHRLDTETLGPAERVELQEIAGRKGRMTMTTPLLIGGISVGVFAGFGGSMAEMGGGFYTGWAKPTALTGGLAAGLLGGLILATVIDRD